MRRALATFSLAGALLAAASPVGAHPAPFSYLDVRLNAGGVSGALVVHVNNRQPQQRLAARDAQARPVGLAQRRVVIGDDPSWIEREKRRLRPVDAVKARERTK